MTNLKFQLKPKILSFKNPHIKIDLLPRGQNPLSYLLYSIMNLNTQYPCLGRQHQKKGFGSGHYIWSFNFVEIYLAICEVGSSTFVKWDCHLNYLLVVCRKSFCCRKRRFKIS